MIFYKLNSFELIKKNPQKYQHFKGCLNRWAFEGYAIIGFTYEYVITAYDNNEQKISILENIFRTFGVKATKVSIGNTELLTLVSNYQQTNQQKNNEVNNAGKN